VLWKAQTVLAFLQREAAAATRRFDAGDAAVCEAWAGKRQRVIPATLYRHMLLSNFRSANRDGDDEKEPCRCSKEP